eukprot:scaffold184620_cov33-Tisochrysis_lutea.AAC.1
MSASVICGFAECDGGGVAAAVARPTLPPATACANEGAAGGSGRTGAASAASGAGEAARTAAVALLPLAPAAMVRVATSASKSASISARRRSPSSTLSG